MFFYSTNISLINYYINFFAVLDLYRLVISFITFINIVCCLKVYLHQTMQMRFVFVLKMFQDKCNGNCNRDHFHVIVIDYIVILFIHNRNRASAK